MKNFSYDLLILGHAIEDKIFVENFEPITKWGGVYNVARSFTSLNKENLFKLKIEPYIYGEALIRIDKKNSLKEVITVNLNKVNKKPNLEDARWFHFCYANEAEIPNLTNYNAIKSADLCAGKELKSIDIFDYIFLSDEEHDARKMSKEIKNTKFISHSPEKICIWKNSKKQHEIVIKNLIKNVNCLGVGDNFAASFIFKKLNNCTDESAINFAKKECEKFLLTNE